MVIGRKERVGEALEVKTFGDLRTKLGSDIINRHNYQNVNGEKKILKSSQLYSHMQK